ncbi:MAG: class I tRNA ligase family protein, partial [Actinomycetota bacterium]
RAIIGRNGRIVAEPPDAVDVEAFATIAGQTVKQAQRVVVEQLQASGEMLGEARPIQHPVKFYEKGDRPLEIVASRQWYLRNGGRSKHLQQALIERGREMTWHPAHMRHRFENWIEGLNGDWLVSRQRFFGVPIPVWYPLDGEGEPDYDRPLLPSEDRLPVDPSTDAPDGYTAEQRGVPGGFIGDSDVFDTWATSSLTPQIAGLWEEADSDLFDRVFPMDMRPQAHDIIRTWLFATTVRSHYEHRASPWTNCALSGWILDPDRKKMSKSKGNTITPIDLFDSYGTDAVRYWAASARPGTDTAFSEDQMKVGRKLANKLLNVSRFVLGIGDADPDTAPTHPIDLAMIDKLDSVIGEATTAFDAFDYARALERTESFFWWFCDDYVELVKGRAYGSQGDVAAGSARAALTAALDAIQRLLAPFLPFAAEEAWSWWRPESVHVQNWPAPLAGGGDADILDPVLEVLTLVRRTKTEAKVSQRAGVASLSVTLPASQVAWLEAGRADLAEAGSIAAITVIEGDALACAVELEPTT